MLKAMLRGLFAHKLRLILSGLAVILGTAFMTAAYVGGDTIRQGFNELFSTVNENVVPTPSSDSHEIRPP